MLKQFYYKKNRIQQLRGFYYTVRCGSVSNASKKLGLTQAAVTLQIQSLERDLNLNLFVRDKKKISLTREGKLFFSHAALYIQSLDSLFDGFADFVAKEKSQVIDIGANHVSISYILPKYIKRFKDENSGVKFKIRNLTKDDGISRLLNDQIDMFLYPIRPEEMPEELDFIPIVNYQPILLIKKNNLLAKKKRITLEDIKRYELVRIDQKLVTLPAFEELVKSHGIRTAIEFEMADWEILKRFVKAEIGVAVISNIALEGENDPDLLGMSLVDFFPEMRYGVLVKKGKIFNGLLKSFFKLLTKERLLQAQN